MARSSDRRLLWLAVALLFVRWALHAAYLPVFEGPDEPFHLARARLFTESLIGSSGLGTALEGRNMDGELLRSVRRVPCGADLERAFSCPPMASADAEWNALRGENARVGMRPYGARATENYQAHQPPLYYAVAGVVLAPVYGTSVETQLLVLRLFAVLLSAAATWLVLPLLDRGWRWVFVAGLWLPGATESLVRVANDAPVFLWAAVILRCKDWPASRARTATLAALLAIGPLIKLTALPIAVFLLVDELRNRRWRRLVVLTLAVSLFLPLQWLRGWAWGGTLEVEAGVASSDPFGTVLLGLAHSAYTFVKTAMWLGGWSVFRPPGVLLIAGAALLGVWALGLRPREEPRSLAAHGAALAVALAGFLAFAIGKRELFGIWGAVGGWYAWAWWPWLCQAGRDVLANRWTPERRRLLIGVSVAWILAFNAAWWMSAHGVYGADGSAEPRNGSPRLEEGPGEQGPYAVRREGTRANFHHSHV